MIVEHVFVTTRDQSAAFEAARGLLVSFGFAQRESEDPKCEKCGYSLKGISLDLPCPECGLARPGARRISFARGKKKPNKAPYSYHENPLVVMLEFDRGRITAVLSLEMYHRKPHELQTQMLTSLATAIEGTIAGNAEAAAPAWAVHNRVVKRARVRKWISGVLLAIILSPVVLIAIAVVVSLFK